MNNDKQTKWISQQKLADDMNVTIQRVHNWVQRKKIETKYDADLKMHLVNPDSITIRNINR